MKKYKFVFAGKISGYYRELDDSNTAAKENSIIYPASTKKWFEQNAKKAYAGYKVVINWVG